MSESICMRARDAEAVEDHRLSGAARAAFLEHAEHCEVCTERLRACAALSEVMRNLPAFDASPAQVRRSRAEVVRRAAEARGQQALIGRRHAYLMFAAALFAVAAFFVERNFFRAPAGAPSVASAVGAPAPSFDVANIEGAVWETKVEGGTARSSLTHGVAQFHVHRLAAGQRFLLALPDGEIEVHGTHFVVDVQGGKTRSVDVSEGVVTLRLHGVGETVLQAGERWSEPSAAPSSEPVAPATGSPRAPGSSIVAPAPPAATPSASAEPAPDAAGSAPAPAAGSAPPVAETPAQRFLDAASAFQSGSYQRADALLAAFQRDFPRDPRGEDAAFLRAMAHARMGDGPGAASLARAYLASYPNGLRRREAQQLAGP